mgnify:CR=1 FL=1
MTVGNGCEDAGQICMWFNFVEFAVSMPWGQLVSILIALLDVMKLNATPSTTKANAASISNLLFIMSFLSNYEIAKRQEL